MSYVAKEVSNIHLAPKERAMNFPVALSHIKGQKIPVPPKN